MPIGEPYVKNMACAVGSSLLNTPYLYKTYGVYWWAVKAALRKYFPGEAWFMGGYFDQLMYERAWHGSLFRTVLAGAVYAYNHPIITSGHEYTNREDVVVDYTLFDANAGL